MWNIGSHDVRDGAHKERISSKCKGTSGLALPWGVRSANARPNALFWQARNLILKFSLPKLFTGGVESHNSTIGGDQSESCNHNATATAFDIQIHWSRWVDSPEFVGLIGKTNIVRTAIVADISEG
jgi:hypothetical protein